jgi:hypothetical protein
MRRHFAIHATKVKCRRRRGSRSAQELRRDRCICGVAREFVYTTNIAESMVESERFDERSMTNTKDLPIPHGTLTELRSICMELPEVLEEQAWASVR